MDILKSVFFCSQPKLYFEAIKFNAMMISFYLALWFVNFNYEADNTNHQVLYRFLSVCPVLFSVLVYSYIIRSAGVMLAVIHLDDEVLIKILEEEEDVKHLGIALKNKIMNRLQILTPENKDLELGVVEFFTALDIDNSNKLSRLEFKEALRLMNIPISTAKWKEIFKVIDSNHDGHIQIDELHSFLFPDSVLAKEMKLKEDIEANNKQLKIAAWKARRSAVKSSSFGLFGSFMGQKIIASDNDSISINKTDERRSTIHEGSATSGFISKIHLI